MLIDTEALINNIDKRIQKCDIQEKEGNYWELLAAQDRKKTLIRLRDIVEEIEDYYMENIW